VIQLVDTKTNKIVMLGYADSATSGSPFANGQGKISATSTADVLLFIGLEGGLFPTANWSNFLNLIHSSPQEAQVAAAVTASIAAHPTAISDGDPAILNAVAAVQSTYVAPTPHWQSSVQRVTVTRTAQGALINVSPGDPQSSLVVAPNPKGDGIVAVSNSRRRGVLFIYKVASGPSATQTTPINPPIEVGSDIDVEPEEEIGSFFVSLAKGLQGNFGYQPVTNPPVLLAADPFQEVAVYDVVAIGPGATDTFKEIEDTVSGGNDPVRLAMDKAWRAANSKTYLKVAVKDIVIPTCMELIMGSGEAKTAAADSATETAVEGAVESLPDVTAALASRDIKGAITAFFSDVSKDKAGIKKVLFAALARKLVSSGIISPDGFQIGLTRLTQALSIIGTINKAFLGADLSRAVLDNTIYNTADVWKANVLQPKATLLPNPATVNNFQNIAILTAQLQGISDLSKLRFEWITSGTQGSLEEPHDSIAMPSGPTTFNQAAYVADLLKLKNGQSDTVTVKIFSANDLRTPLATATAVVTARPGVESGEVSIDSKDDFLGIVKNDPWVLSEVVTCPFVKGATSYIVSAFGPTTGTFSYLVSTAGGKLLVTTADHKPYLQYVATAGGVTICVFGVDAYNAKVTNAADIIKREYPITTVNVTYK
jgi:hypothetical protein